jgi:hypothetical protein
MTFGPSLGDDVPYSRDRYCATMLFIPRGLPRESRVRDPINDRETGSGIKTITICGGRGSAPSTGEEES